MAFSLLLPCLAALTYIRYNSIFSMKLILGFSGKQKKKKKGEKEYEGGKNIAQSEELTCTKAQICEIWAVL